MFAARVLARKAEWQADGQQQMQLVPVIPLLTIQQMVTILVILLHVFLSRGRGCLISVSGFEYVALLCNHIVQATA